MPVDLLEGLSGPQIDAVKSPAAPLAVIAGPGSGKTRVLTHRVAWRVAQGEADPARTLVLTFSRRAAGELYGRLGRLGLPAGARDGGVRAGTFHAMAWAELTRHRADRGLPALTILGRPARLLAPALARALGREPLPAEIASASRELAWARLQGLDAASFPESARRGRRRPAVPAEAFAAAWSAYERAKRDRRVLDLDDLLEDCTGLMTSDPEVAQAARWRYRHLFVDEYQDLNPAHRRLLAAWVAGRPDLCLVGDPDQAVYGFNGAAPDLFDRVVADWPGIEVIHLTDNHRSTPEIVTLAEAIRPPGERPQLVSTRLPGPVPALVAHADATAEADRVAADLAARRASSSPWSGMAVLARTNARLRIVAAALDRAGVPWRLRDPRPLAERPSIKRWLKELPPRSPACDLRELLVVADSTDVEVDADRAALLGALSEFEVTVPGGSVAGLASWLDASGVTAEEAPAPGVDLATFHRAKGLEWSAVWVIGAEEGLVPVAGDAATVAEEQRLLYVALTRARDELSVSWAAIPSRWVPALEDARAGLAATAAPDEAHARLQTMRAQFSPAAAQVRLAALREWRESRARAARIPPGVVIADHLLAVLAREPVTSEGDVIRLAGAAGRRAHLWAPEVLRVLQTAQ